MMTFDSLGLPGPLLASLKFLKFQNPTPIQAEAIPLALKGADILGSAQTGTGKTAAYALPLVAHLLSASQDSALVLTPTRELALQVFEFFKSLLGKKISLSSALLIGGAPIGKQLQDLKRHPRLIVGTPGRVLDHLSRKSLRLDQTRFVVFDETDRMLDMGFEKQLREISQNLPQKRQTLMFSATFSSDIVKIAQNYLKDPTRISVGSLNTPIQKIQQDLLRTSEGEKYSLLLKQLGESEGSFIVFVKTKRGADRIADKLCENGHKASALHGDLRQRKRDQVVQAFRNFKTRVLVATDVAARGLDIPHIEYVINYDLPQCPEDYIHRIGRTGRAGASGKAMSFITPQDSLKWKNICKMMNGSEKREEPQRSNPKPKGSPRPFKGKKPKPFLKAEGFKRSKPQKHRRAA